MQTMMYSEGQERSKNVFRVYVCAVLALVLLFMSVSIARPAHAQGAEQNASHSSNFPPPDFPFGYGGGPRGPTPPPSPNAAVIVGQVISRINAMLARLFNR
jgi:hypothetical protein